MSGGRGLQYIRTGMLVVPFKAGVHLKALFFAGYYVFNANISFTFQAIKNLYAHFIYLCFGPLCKFFGDF